jgi:hypothetical protein
LPVYAIRSFVFVLFLLQVACQTHAAYVRLPRGGQGDGRGGEEGGQGLVKARQDEVKRQDELKKQDELKRAMPSGLAMKEIVGVQGRILERERGTSSYYRLPLIPSSFYYRLALIYWSRG